MFGQVGPFGESLVTEITHEGLYIVVNCGRVSIQSGLIGEPLVTQITHEGFKLVVNCSYVMDQAATFTECVEADPTGVSCEQGRFSQQESCEILRISMVVMVTINIVAL